MQAPSSALAERLQQLQESCSAGIRIEADAAGARIDLAEPRLGFHHSFLGGAISRRAGQSDQLLLKACNNRQRSIKSVLDLTAGWGIDAFILARHGQRVTMLEQNELVYSIVAWSLQQLNRDGADTEVARRMSSEHADSLDYLRALPDQPRFDCIYLDPMFDASKSGAKPAKEMQILQALTANSQVDSCFELALLRAGKRVVVKRAAKAPTLTLRKPDLVHRSRSIRFDVYLVA